MKKIDKVTAQHIARKANRTKILISSLSIALASTLLILFAIFATGTLSNPDGMFEIRSFGKDDGVISLSETADFSEPTVALQAKAMDRITNISGVRDIPADVDSRGDGSHNGEDYFAYTFYLRNTGKVDVDVEENIKIVSAMKDVDKAIRVKVYRDGVDTTYAAPSKTGAPEYGTAAFLDKDTVFSNKLEKMESGETVKYTIVVWVEGDDPECLQNIMGGFVRFEMNFKVISVSDQQTA